MDCDFSSLENTNYIQRPQSRETTKYKNNLLITMNTYKSTIQSTSQTNIAEKTNDRSNSTFQNSNLCSKDKRKRGRCQTAHK
jgi:hypothetical protein